MIRSTIKNFLLRRKLSKIYPKVFFGSNISIEDSHKLYNLNIHDYVYIGSNAEWSLRGKITIKENVIIGPKSVFWPYNHNYKSENYLPYGPKKEDIIKNITIENNVWIGRNVTILAGVTIGEGSVIAANTTVVKDVPKLAIVGGNPSRIIKYRDESQYSILKNNNKYYLKEKFS